MEEYDELFIHVNLLTSKVYYFNTNEYSSYTKSIFDYLKDNPNSFEEISFSSSYNFILEAKNEYKKGHYCSDHTKYKLPVFTSVKINSPFTFHDLATACYNIKERKFRKTHPEMEPITKANTYKCEIDFKN